MTSQRMAVTRLCHTLLRINSCCSRAAVINHSYIVNHKLLPTAELNTFSRCYKDFKVVTDSFDDEKFNKYFENENDDELLDTGTRKRDFYSEKSQDFNKRGDGGSSSDRPVLLDFSFDDKPKNYNARYRKEFEDFNEKNEAFIDDDGDFFAEERSRYDSREDYERTPRRSGRYFDSSNDSRNLQWSEDRQSSNSWSTRDRSSSQYREGRNLRWSDGPPRMRQFRGSRDQFAGRTTMEDLWGRVKQSKKKYNENEVIQKDHYEEHPDVTNRTQEEIQSFMDSHQMTVDGANAKRPIFQFQETGFPDEIITALKSSFDQPTPIQSIGWPHALSGCDIVGIAQTGSGKTLSFLLPAMLHIQQSRKTATGEGPIALVVCPTRELAMQCHSIAKKFGRYGRMKSAVVYGGQSKLVQAEKLLEPGIDMVIATPGRLLDFLSTDVISFDRCSYVVLDEADMMLDMGFEPQIRAVMEQIRPDRQVLMWSATWPEEIQDLANDFLKDYVHVKIGSQKQTVNTDITHEFQYCSRYDKPALLLNHLTQNTVSENSKIPAKTLVFCQTKSQCSRLQGILMKNRISSNVTHGDKSQSHRDHAMHNFRSGRVPVLIASDVAARGIDVNDIEYVVNYDLPRNIENYIHRVGRTGRAGRKGTAISYMTSEELEMVSPIMKLLQDCEQEIPEILEGLLQKGMRMKNLKKQKKREERRFRNSGYFDY